MNNLSKAEKENLLGCCHNLPSTTSSYDSTTRWSYLKSPCDGREYFLAFSSFKLVCHKETLQTEAEAVSSISEPHWEGKVRLFWSCPCLWSRIPARACFNLQISKLCVQRHTGSSNVWKAFLGAPKQWIFFQAASFGMDGRKILTLDISASPLCILPLFIPA